MLLNINNYLLHMLLTDHKRQSIKKSAVLSPTCPVCFGDKPPEAATHFGTGKVIMLKRLYGWSNEGLPRIPVVLNFAHISAGLLSQALRSNKAARTHPTSGVSKNSNKTVSRW